MQRVIATRGLSRKLYKLIVQEYIAGIERDGVSEVEGIMKIYTYLHIMCTDLILYIFKP